MPNLAQPFIQGASTGQILQQQALQTQNAQLQNQGTQLRNQQAALQLHQEQQYSQMLQKMATSSKEGSSPSDQMMQMGLAAMKAGLPQGVQLVNQAVESQYKLAMGAAAANRGRADQVKADIAQKQFAIQQHEQQMLPLAGALDSVHDQASWDRYTQLAAQRGDKEYLGTPYNPQLVDSLRYEMLGAKNAIAGAKARLDAQQKQAAMEERQRHDTVMERLGQARIAVEQVSAQARTIQAQASAERAKRLDKVGAGKTVAPPPTSMQMQAQDMISKQFPDMKTAEASDFAYSVASRAKALQVKNPGMDAQQAIMESLNELKDSQVVTVPGQFWQSPKEQFNPQGTGVKLSVKTPEEVVAAYKEGKIPKAEAENFLRAMGAH